MKTRTFFLLCLFIGIGLTELGAQNYSYVGKGKIYEDIVWPVFCTDENGEIILVDILTGGIEVEHHIGHVKNGVAVWCNSQYTGTIFGSNGEKFRIKEVWRTEIQVEAEYIGVVTGKIHLVGDEGTHYIMSCIVDWYSFTITEVTRAVCPGPKK
ncbi:MAG: hypothetical protein MUE32_02955 [Bacteroidales bacterium]|jgi:hypothetical protein|nr:hypothetical protein [Bacteroidales bacterium]